ncbi:MAG: single-stranded DNA-binding protein [Clostridiaceae bacterium]|mgnify:CR=1 FL=1|jgi:single-stranded DNA-binding protein|nr:single-stranded DNA-binding protein [Clostridiaceae bacterium]
MPGNIMENNSASLTGKIISKPEFSHEVYGEGFYIITVEVPRLSDTYDYIPVMFSERLLPLEKFEVGKIAVIEGQFRSYNNYNSEGGHKLLLTVFARDIVILDEPDEVKASNSIYLNGFICKAPVYRTTPFGREIADILLAVNRAYNKSDYIPCIAWGRNARYASNFEIGDNIKVWGRIQSRNYQKKLPDGSVEERTAYEVSISKMEIIKNNNNKNDRQ